MPMTMAQRAMYNALQAEKAGWEDRMEEHRRKGRWEMYRNAREVVRAHEIALQDILED